MTDTPPPRTATLGRLCSADPDHFATHVWSRRPWLSRAHELDPPETEVFSPAAVDELLSERGLRTPFLRLAKDGRVLPAGRFTGSGGVGARISDQVLDDAVLRLFADGTTVVLQGLHRTWAPVRDLAAGLATDLGHPVQVNAYVTPAQSQGFAPHYDTHDVFVLQIHGTKAWQVHDPVIDAPLPDQPWEAHADDVRTRAAGTPVLDATLEPGDCLYLPRGFIHSAQTGGGLSIHLTFGIHPVVQRDVLRAIVDVVQSDGWRASLPVGWDPYDRIDIEGIVHDVRQALERIDVSQVAARLHDLRTALQRPGPIGPLAQVEAAATVGTTDVVRLRAHLGARLGAEGELVVAGGRTVAVTEVTPDAIAALLTGRPVAVADLTAPTADAIATARRLMVEGVLVMDPRTD